MIIKGIKVGTTDVTSTYVDGDSRSDTKQIEVVAASLEYIYRPEDTVYTGSEIRPTPSVVAHINGVETELVYGEDYTLSYSNNINVGNATVTATGIGNYTGTVGAQWTITPASLTVTANDQSYEYNGTLQGTSISATGVGSDVSITIQYGLSQGTYNLSSPPQIKNVNDSRTVYFKVSAPNHTDYIGSYELSISPRPATLSWGRLSWTYDGTAHHTTCVVSNLIAGDTCDVELYGNSITEIGSGIVTARASSSLSNPNYVLLADESRTLTVSPGLFMKLANDWIPVKKVFKMVSGTWVQQEPGNAFSTSAKYVKLD